MRVQGRVSTNQRAAIIDEVDAENHHSRVKLNSQSILQLNEESVNVDLETSKEMAEQLNGPGSKFSDVQTLTRNVTE